MLTRILPGAGGSSDCGRDRGITPAMNGARTVRFKGGEVFGRGVPFVPVVAESRVSEVFA